MFQLGCLYIGVMSDIVWVEKAYLGYRNLGENEIALTTEFRLFYFNVGPPKDLFDPIYGLYFSHKHTFYKLQSFTLSSLSTYLYFEQAFKAAGPLSIYTLSQRPDHPDYRVSIHINRTMPKGGLIHQRRVILLMKQALYPQATTAGLDLAKSI